MPCPRSVVLPLCIAVALVGATASFAAAAKTVETIKVDGERSGVSITGAVTVDWTRGLIVARGAAAADLRAPSPSVARLKAERKARRQARLRIEAALPKLRFATEQLGRALSEPRRAKRLSARLRSLLTVSVDHGSDGSVVVVLALPIESVRDAVAGPFTSLPASPAKPVTIAIDASKVRAVKPAVGMLVGAGGGSVAVPVRYVTSKSAAKALLGSAPTWIAATGYKAGTVSISKDRAAAIKAMTAAGGAVLVLLNEGASR